MTQFSNKKKCELWLLSLFSFGYTLHLSSLNLTDWNGPKSAAVISWPHELIKRSRRNEGSSNGYGMRTLYYNERDSILMRSFSVSPTCTRRSIRLSFSLPFVNITIICTLFSLDQPQQTYEMCQPSLIYRNYFKKCLWIST